MKIYTINTHKDLCKYRDIWLRGLDGHRGAKHPFLDFDWISTYCKHFLKDRRLGVTICRDNDKIAILPFYYVCKGYRELNYIGKGLSDYGDIITNYSGLSWLKDIFIYNKVDSVRLFNVRDDSPLLSEAESAVSDDSDTYTVKVEDSVKSPYLNLNSKSWDDYFNSLDKKFRADILRQIERLKSLGELKFGCCDNIGQLTDILNVMYSQHIKRREYLGQYKSIFLNIKIKNFYGEINEKMFLTSRLLLFYLMLNDDVIAVAMCFLYDKNLYYYIPTFDIKFTKYSPSKVLLYYLIRYSFNHHLNEFDFMIGDEGYKLRWKTKIRQTHNISFFKNSFLGKIAFLNSKTQSFYGAIERRLINSKLKDIKQKIFKIFYKVRPCL